MKQAITFYQKIKRHSYRLLCLILLTQIFVFNGFAQTQLELSNSSYPSAPNGLTLSNQTASLLQNTSGSTFTTFNPTITVTASISNQQYNSISTSRVSTGKGMSFGGRVNSYGTVATQVPVYNSLNTVDNPVNTQYTSNPNGPNSTGINVADNYGFYFYNSVDELFATNAATNGRYYFGDITLTFSQPVTNPVIHINGLGCNVLFGITDKQGITSELELQTSGVSLSKLSGSSEFDVTANKILNNAATPSFNCGSGAACGSVKVTGTNITTLTFKVYVRGDGNGSAWSHNSINAGDEFMLSASINTPVMVAGNVFNDTNGLTDNTVNGTGTNVGGSLFINLIDTSGLVVASVFVANDGSYLFNNIGSGNYTLVLSTTQGTQGNAAPAANLPSGWVNSGEHIGTNTGNDGIPNGILPVTVSGSNISNANFGITSCSNMTTVITANGATTACLGAGLTLTSTTAINYQWYKDSVAITGATSQSFVPIVSGTYTMHVISGGVCNISSNAISVTINYAPTIGITPSDTANICVANNDKICPATWGSSNYQWYKNGIAMAAPQGTSSCLYPTSAGNYSMAVQTGAGCWSLPSTSVYVKIDTVCSNIVSSGGGGGLETKPLGDVIAIRLYGNAVNSKATDIDYAKAPAYVSHSGTVINGGNKLLLADIIPQSTINTNKSYVSTPTDLIAFTNAIDILSVDYASNNDCKAVVLGTQTIGDVYGHTKPICDRLKDAKLLEVKTVNIAGIDMIASKLQQRDGLVEYCINFSIGLNKNATQLALQSNWLTDNYAQQDTMFNFQVWSVSYSMSKTLVEQMLTKLSTYKIVAAHSNNVADMPKAFMQSIRRDKNVLEITVNNPTSNTTGTFEVLEKANENSNTNKKIIPFTIAANATTVVKINVSDVYENNVYMHLSNNNADMAYMTDGGWSADYDKVSTILNIFNITNTVTSIKENEYPLFRKVQVEASTKSYVSAYKLVKGGGIERNFSQYKAIKFNATSITGAAIKITLIKKGITNWDNQYTYTLPANASDNEYAISLSQFKSKQSNSTINANDIVAVSFSWVNSKNIVNNIGGSLANIRFTTQDANNVQAVTTNEIGIYPNPNNGKFKVVFNADADKPVALKLTDVSTGRIVYTQFVNAKKGVNTIEVSVTNFFTSNNYILTIEADDAKYNSKKVFMQSAK